MSIRRFIEARHPVPDALRSGIEQAQLQFGDPAQLARVRAAVDRRVGGAGGGSLPPLGGSGGGAASGWTRGQWLTLVGGSLAALLAALWPTAVPGVASGGLLAPASASIEGASAPAPSYLVLGRSSAAAPEAPVAPPAAVDAGAPARARPRVEVGQPSPQPAMLDPQGELEILRRAQAALRSRPTESLAQVQLHEARYAAGVFAQEREVIRIDALFALQRDGDARQRAREFLAKFGDSTHAPRMRALLGAP
jgi:hypothetical protein